MTTPAPVVDIPPIPAAPAAAVPGVAAEKIAKMDTQTMLLIAGILVLGGVLYYRHKKSQENKGA